MDDVSVGYPFKRSRLKACGPYYHYIVADLTVSGQDRPAFIYLPYLLFDMLIAR